MFGENYKWNYDYVRLAHDCGFSFEKSKNNSYDKNKICLIDIDRIIEEKDVGSVETFIPCITQFVLDTEQAEILDNHFVKIFHLSQLTIQYLLFCKKYLDKFLTQFREEFDKVKEDNKELNLFVEDLKEHIARLMEELKNQSAAALFRCEYCNKMFSNEEFLESHIARRHKHDTTKPSLELEAKKLHTEIKELKGRLNSAEKLIHKDHSDIKSACEIEFNHKSNESKKIDELQQKFEELRLQVQSELKILQSQYNFQEKYDRLLEKMSFENMNKQIDTNKDEVTNLEKKREGTTQTEEATKVKESIVTNKENIPDFSNTQKQFTELEEAIELKVSSSLDRIEKQMESFWSKLNEMDMYKRATTDGSRINQGMPTVRPRSKYTITRSQADINKKSFESKNVTDISNNESEESNKPLTKMMQVRISEINQESKENFHSEPVKNFETKAQLHALPGDYNEKTVQPVISISESENESVTMTSDDTSKKKSIQILKSQKKSSCLITKKRSQTNNATKNIKVNPKLFNHFKEEVEKIMVMGRLQDLGVSPDWKGLPSNSFERVLEIVNHRASLMKKTYPDFDKIANQIEENVNKKLKEMLIANKKHHSIKGNPKREKKLVTIVSSKDKPQSSHVEIKNRKMYETDSDSEPVRCTSPRQNLKVISVPYSAVIEELKSVTTRYESSDKSASDSNSVKEEVHKVEETKGVLRNNPAANCTVKKKVLFNLEEDRSPEKAINNKEGGSTTSVASSVLDGSPQKPTKVTLNEKDIEDLSDFDFSDM